MDESVFLEEPSTPGYGTSVCTVTIATFFLQLVSDVVNKQTKPKRYPKNLNRHYDFVIVGAGSAGCVVANRLSEINDWSVLLLETGDDEPDIASVPAFEYYIQQRSNINYVYQTEPNEKVCNGQGCSWPRGVVVGGSSVINGMIYNRGNKKNFDHWAEIGNYGWDYNTVLKYFKKSENNKNDVDHRYHGFDGYLNVENLTYIDDNMKRLHQSFINIGYKDNPDLNAEDQLGVTYSQYTMDNGRRHSTNHAFLQPALKTRRNLHVITNAKVTKVLIDPRKNEAYGVEYMFMNDTSKVHRVDARKEVILSAGSLESPHILMLSGVGPRDTLEKFNIELIKDLPVGQNLQDHLISFAVVFNIGEYSTIPKTITQYFTDILKYVANEGPFTTPVPSSVIAYTRTNLSDDIPDIQFHVVPGIVPGYNESVFIDAEYDKCPENYPIYPTCYYNRLFIAPVLLYPKSRGNITLRSADPIDDPLIYDGYFSDDRDLDVLLQGIYEALKLRNETLIKAANWTLSDIPPEMCSSYEFDTDDYWRCAIPVTSQTVFHPVGTCKMGSQGDDTAVVDPELRVHGIGKLRVIDASIMPYIVGANTNAAAIMIGEKGADMVKRFWQRRQKH